jgi:hypothetical protein
VVAVVSADASEVSVVFDFLGLMGLGGLIFIWVSHTRINTANFYVASLRLESFLARLTHIKLASRRGRRPSQRDATPTDYQPLLSAAGGTRSHDRRIKRCLYTGLLAWVRAVAPR